MEHHVIVGNTNNVNIYGARDHLILEADLTSVAFVEKFHGNINTLEIILSRKVHVLNFVATLPKYLKSLIFNSSAFVHFPQMILDQLPNLEYLASIELSTVIRTKIVLDVLPASLRSLNLNNFDIEGRHNFVEKLKLNEGFLRIIDSFPNLKTIECKELKVTDGEYKHDMLKELNTILMIHSDDFIISMNEIKKISFTDIINATLSINKSLCYCLSLVSVFINIANMSFRILEIPSNVTDLEVRANENCNYEINWRSRDKVYMIKRPRN